MKKRNLSLRKNLEEDSYVVSTVTPISSQNPSTRSTPLSSKPSTPRSNEPLTALALMKNIDSFRCLYPKPSDKLKDLDPDYVTNCHIMLWYYNASELVCEESLNKLIYVSEDAKQRYPLATAFLALLHSENIHFPNILNKQKAMDIADLVFPYLLDNIHPVVLYDIYQEAQTFPKDYEHSFKNGAKYNFYNSPDTFFYAHLMTKMEEFQTHKLEITPPTQEQIDLCMYSEYIVGHFYEKGLLSHCPYENYHEAFQWFLSSAKRGFFLSQVAAGYLCEYGFPGVEIDLNKAMELYRESSKQGDATALYNLGIFYDNGKVVEKDDKKALSFYIESAQQGFDKAQLQIGNYFHDILSNYKESIKWYTLSANKENPEAQFCLGLIHFYGKGTKRNFNLARKFFELSAKNSIMPDSEAQYYLARCCLEGLGGPVDYPEAKKWAQKSLDSGEEKSQGILDKLAKKKF